jgi:hypothetical protein
LLAATWHQRHHEATWMIVLYPTQDLWMMASRTMPGGLTFNSGSGYAALT